MTIAILSSDSHVVEPQTCGPHAWSQNSVTGHRAWCRRTTGTGGLWTASARTPFKAGHRLASASSTTAVKPAARFAEVRPGAYLPEAHLADNEADGVYGSVLYPTEGLTLGVPDSDLLTAVFRVYNDWIAEFCQAAPQRLKGIAMINVDDIPGAIKELERTRARGLVGAMITVYPAEERSYDRPEYEPFWAATGSRHAPSLHIATNRPSPACPSRTTVAPGPPSSPMPIIGCVSPWASDLHWRL